MIFFFGFGQPGQGPLPGSAPDPMMLLMQMVEVFGQRCQIINQIIRTMSLILLLINMDIKLPGQNIGVGEAFLKLNDLIQDKRGPPSNPASGFRYF